MCRADGLLRSCSKRVGEGLSNFFISCLEDAAQKKWRGSRLRLGGKTDNHFASPRIIDWPEGPIDNFYYIGLGAECQYPF
jgi:hypothetical protein